MAVINNVRTLIGAKGSTLIITDLVLVVTEGRAPLSIIAL